MCVLIYHVMLRSSLQIKSVTHLIQTFLSVRLIVRLLHTTAETVERMSNIGRDDGKLPMRVKDIFMIEFGFVVDSLLMPSVGALKAFLLKVSSSRPSSANMAMLAADFLIALSTINICSKNLKIHFDNLFSKPLGMHIHASYTCLASNARILR